MASFYIPSAASAAKSSPIQGYSNVISKTNPYTSNAWIGAAIGAGASLLGGLFGNKSQSSNINKQIQAQQEENAKNREYNLMLAQMQNQWNQEQWERENDYNSPEAQMERLKKAGLNPDLMMSQGAHNIAASSPMMTSGAPSQPTDMSALGQKPTLGQAIQTALRDSMIGAQIDNIKAQTEKTRSETEGKNMENDVQRELKEFLGLDIKDVDYINEYYLSPQAQKAIYELRKLKSEASILNNQEENSDIDITFRRLNYTLEKEITSKQWRTLSAQLDMSEQEAKDFVKQAYLRLRGLKADVDLKESEAVWNNADFFKELPNGLPLVVKFLRMCFGK